MSFPLEDVDLFPSLRNEMLLAIHTNGLKTKIANLKDPKPILDWVDGATAFRVKDAILYGRGAESERHPLEPNTFNTADCTQPTIYQCVYSVCRVYDKYTFDSEDEAITMGAFLKNRLQNWADKITQSQISKDLSPIRFFHSPEQDQNRQAGTTASSYKYQWRLEWVLRTVTDSYCTGG